MSDRDEKQVQIELLAEGISNMEIDGKATAKVAGRAAKHARVALARTNSNATRITKMGTSITMLMKANDARVTKLERALEELKHQTVHAEGRREGREQAEETKQFEIEKVEKKWSDLFKMEKQTTLGIIKAFAMFIGFLATVAGCIKIALEMFQ